MEGLEGKGGYPLRKRFYEPRGEIAFCCNVGLLPAASCGRKGNLCLFSLNKEEEEETWQ